MTETRRSDLEAMHAYALEPREPREFFDEIVSYGNGEYPFDTGLSFVNDPVHALIFLKGATEWTKENIGSRLYFVEDQIPEEVTFNDIKTAAWSKAVREFEGPVAAEQYQHIIKPWQQAFDALRLFQLASRESKI